MFGHGSRGRVFGFPSSGRTIGGTSQPAHSHSHEIGHLPMVASPPSNGNYENTPSPKTSANLSFHVGTPPSTQGSSAISTNDCMDTRLWVYPEGKEILPHETVRKITMILKTKTDFETFITCWEDVPEHQRDKYWVAFKGTCRWDVKNENEIKRLFFLKCAVNMKNLFASIRRGKSNGKWIPPSVKTQLAQYWEEDETFLQFSEQNKKNRATFQNGWTNLSGSITISEHKRCLTKKLGRQPTMPEVFCKLNQCPNTQEWKQEKAAAIYDKYEELKLTQIAEDSSLDDSTLLLEATGGKNKRGRAYGFGSEVAFFGSSRS